MAVGFIASIFVANAQVSGMPAGYITVAPTVSTESAPVWYNMMATNTDAARVNRYLYTDGTVLKTDLFNSPGITDAIQQDKYLWRLEQGTGGANYVVLVNKLTGKKLFGDVALASNGVVSVANTGIEWKMAAASAVTTGTVSGQYCFNYESAGNIYGIRYLNAGDGVTMSWNVLVFNGAGSPAKSSGWFFYPVTTTKAVTFEQPENGTIAVSATNGTTTPSALTSGTSVLVGTVATVNLTATSNYRLNELTVNGVDVLSQVVNNVYQFTVNADATIVAGFSLSTATNIANQNKDVYLNPLTNELNIDQKVAGSNVYIYDVTGKQAMVSNQNSLNVSSLSNGIYMVKFTTANGTKMVKVIKN